MSAIQLPHSVCYLAIILYNGMKVFYIKEICPIVMCSSHVHSIDHGTFSGQH